MGVGIDDAFHAFLFRQRPPAPVEIEPLRCGIDFDPGSGLGRGINDGRECRLRTDRVSEASGQSDARAS